MPQLKKQISNLNQMIPHVCVSTWSVDWLEGHIQVITYQTRDNDDEIWDRFKRQEHF